MTIETGMTCSKWCWVISGLVGLLAAVLLVINAGFSIISAIIAGVVLAVILGLLLPHLVCGDKRGSVSTTAAAAGAAVATGSIAANATVSGPSAGEGFAEKRADFDASAAIESSVEIPNDIETSAIQSTSSVSGVTSQAVALTGRDTSVTTQISSSKSDELATARAVAQSRAADEQAATLAVERLKQQTKTVPAATIEDIVAPQQAAIAPDYDNSSAKFTGEGAAEGTRPEALAAPRGGKADNLKEIKGVGPKMETLLHELGFYHFDQIAAWTHSEVAWVDANLQGFKGRVSRDDWVAQAKILAAGGTTAFSQKVDKGGVY